WPKGHRRALCAAAAAGAPGAADRWRRPGARGSFRHVADAALRWLRRGLRERLRTSLAQRVPGLVVNGDLEHRLPGSLNVSIPDTTAPDLIEACPSIAISTGSACTSATVEPSYVLRALGLSDERANASIRLGLGRFTTAADIDFAVDAIAAAASRLRAAKAVQSNGAAPT